MLEKHRHLLIRNRPAIVQDLLVEDVLSELRSKFIIDQDDSELVESEKTSQRKAEKLLDLLPNKGYKAFNAFYESLLDKNEHLAKLLESGLSDNDDRTNSEVHSSNNNLSHEAGPMTDAHRELLTSNRVAIVEDLLVDDVLAQLFSNFVFDNNDKELIRSEATSKRQAEKLLDLLVKKGDEAFEHFLSALKDSYPHLAKLLQVDDKGLPGKSRLPSVSEEVLEIVESKLLKGGVPNLPQIFTPRPHERDKLRTALRSLKNRDAWVVLHGMAGSGKTVLAADALRDASLLDETFPGGVVWVQIGPVDRHKLLMKMQNLCKRLDEDKHRPEPRNLEEARERLQNLFTEQHPNKLLVLDDLWSAHDARFFHIRARVLVTTRDVSIADCIEVKRCPVSVTEKLSSSQCRNILAKWTKTKETELPREADDIITECNGHPLVISIFGALLREHPRRWYYYWTQLHNHKLKKFTLKSAYDYSDLNDAIAISIENLEENLRDKFFDFVIFDSSIKVPLSVFCLLWDMEDEIEVEDILGELVKKSLVKTTECPGSPNGCISYAIHNLLLNYLLENCTDIEARHKRLVESYKKASKGDFSSLADDGYVYWNLIHHMIEANQQGKAIQLLTNLAWVTIKLEVSGPADIINDYINVYRLVEEEERDEFKDLNDFYHFLRANAHMFASRPIPDVVQTALSEPAGNEVYKQAKEEALKKSKKGKQLYVDWCNKESENVQSLEMTVKPHNGPIHCCVFSADGKHILSSSSDKTAKVWEAISGKVRHTLVGHDDAVICCAFNHDNTKILTTSHDKTVKVWKFGAGHELLLTYKDHKQDVHCAAFSPNGKNIVSCSADCTIKVWDTETGETSATLTHEGYSAVVRWCCFSSDGLKIASGSHDETVKIWEAASGKCLVTTDKHGSFVSYCCFSRDDTLVYSCAKTFIRVWDSVTGHCLDSININVDVLAFTLSPAGDKLAVALVDATVKVWDIFTKTQQQVYAGHKIWVYTVDFSPDGSQLVSGSADETIKVWPVDTADFVKRVKLKKVFDVFFKETQPLIAVADNQNRIKFFEGLLGKELHCSEAYNAKITCVLFSLDGDRVAIGLHSGQIKIILVPTCQPALTLDGHEGMVYSLNYSTSGALLVSCSKDKTFMLWDTVSGRPLFGKEPRHEDEVTVASFFDNDKRIVTASKDGTAKVWDSASGKLLFTCDHQQNQWVLTCVVSPDNKNIVTGSVNTLVKGWDSSTGQELFEISPHSDVVRSLAINEDNSVFASGSDDGSVQILNLDKGTVLSRCTSHKGAWVADIDFANDCKQLVTVGNNIQWHSTDGKLLQQFFVKGSHLRRIKCSPDFQLFITVDNIGVLYILKVIT